jgi:hypothetical protein
MAPPVWGAPGAWTALLQARLTASQAEPPGNLWFRMTAPDGRQARIHSGLVGQKLRGGWTLGGEFTETDDGVFPA